MEDIKRIRRKNQEGVAIHLRGSFDVGIGEGDNIIRHLNKDLWLVTLEDGTQKLVGSSEIWEQFEEIEE